jgi:hypothetical protein
MINLTLSSLITLITAGAICHDDAVDVENIPEEQVEG